jgi:hypothetical protein
MEKKSSVNLDLIQEMWEGDSQIDPDNLHNESLKVPVLHSKYYNLYNTLLLLRKNAELQKNSVLLERRKYYTGKASVEIYNEEPFPYKVRDKEDLSLYLDTDERLSKIKVKIEYYDVMLKYIEDILKMISNRTYQIKNAIEWNKFQAGYG